MSVSLYFDTPSDSSTEGYGSQLYLGYWDATLDAIAPTLTVITPAEGPTTADAVLVVDIADNIALAYATIFAFLTTATEVVYRGATFYPGYEQSTQATIAGGKRLSIRRSSGWPAGVVRLEADLVDTSGNVGS